MNNIKKYTQKDRYGGSQVFEFHVPEMNIPSKPDEGHPGDPRGTDTVPAWLTPGENVVNAEASRLPGNQQMIDQMNNQGRAIQKQQGGPIPSYEADGGRIPEYASAGSDLRDYLKSVEGVRNDSYKDSAGNYTVGVGNTDNVDANTTLTNNQVDEKLNQDIAVVENDYKNLVNVNLNDNQANSVKSLLFNIGGTNFAKSKALVALNSGDFETYKKEMAEFRLADGKVVPGLENRRASETDLFNKEAPTTYDGRPIEPGFMSAMASTNDSTKIVPPVEGSEIGLGNQISNKIDGGTFDWDKAFGGQNSNPFNKEFYEKGGFGSLEQGERALKYPLEIFGVNTPSNAVGEPTGTLGDKLTPITNALNPSVEDINYGISTKGLANIKPQIIEAKDELDYMTKLITNLEKNGGKPNSSQIEKYKAAVEKHKGLLAEEQNILSINKKHKLALDKENNKNESFTINEDKIKTAKKIVQDTNDANYGEGDQIIDKADEQWAKDNLTGESEGDFAQELINKAKSVGGIVVDKSIEYFKDAFSSMFDGEELARMAMVYAGSRAMGYDHGGSLNYSMKNYMKRVEANKSYAKKAVLDKDFADRFESKSLAKYAKSADVNDLIPKGKSSNLQSVSGSLYVPGYGKMTTFKGADKIDYVTVEGQAIPVPSIRGAEKWDDKVHGDATVAKRYDSFGKNTVDAINEAAGLKSGDDGYTSYRPIGSQANSIYRKILRQNGTSINDAPQMQMAVERAMDKFLQAKSDFNLEKIKIKPNDLESFVNKEVFTQLTGISQSFISGTSPSNLAKIDKDIKRDMTNKNFKSQAYKEEYLNDWQGTLDAYKRIPNDERTQLIKEAAEKSKNKNEWSAFTLWVSRTSPEEIEKILKS